jgi:hypothetical protein
MGVEPPLHLGVEVLPVPLVEDPQHLCDDLRRG